MKKKISLLLIIILLFTTGCAKASISMEIKKDKSMVLTIINAEKSSYVDLDGNTVYNNTDLSDEDKKNYEDNGFYIQRYIEDDFIGYQFTKNINNIDDFSTDEVLDSKTSSENIILKDKPLFTIEKTFFKNTYKANFNLSALTKNYNNNNYLNESGNYVTSAITSDLDLNFSLTLPYKALSNNATSVSEDGKNLIWDLTKISNVEFEFVIYDMTKIYIVCGVGALFLLSFFASIIRSIKKNSKPNYKKMYDNNKYNYSNTNVDTDLNSNIVSQPISYETDSSIENVENSSISDSKSLFTWENTNLQNNDEVINSNDVFASPNININNSQVINNDNYNSVNNVNSNISNSNVISDSSLNNGIGNHQIDVNNSQLINSNNYSSIDIPGPILNNSVNQSNINTVSEQNNVLDNTQMNYSIQQPAVGVMEQPVNQVDIPAPIMQQAPVMNNDVNNNVVQQVNSVGNEQINYGMQQQPAVGVMEQPINQVDIPAPIMQQAPVMNNDVNNNVVQQVNSVDNVQMNYGVQQENMISTITDNNANNFSQNNVMMDNSNNNN